MVTHPAPGDLYAAPGEVLAFVTALPGGGASEGQVEVEPLATGIRQQLPLATVTRWLLVASPDQSHAAHARCRG